MQDYNVKASKTSALRTTEFTCKQIGRQAPAKILRFHILQPFALIFLLTEQRL